MKESVMNYDKAKKAYVESRDALTKATRELFLVGTYCVCNKGGRYEVSIISHAGQGDDCRVRVRNCTTEKAYWVYAFHLEPIGGWN